MAAKKETTEQPAAEAGNVDQIREILFGGHLRAFDERFALVETRLAKETEALRKATEKRMQELERLAAEVRDEASDRLGAEANSRELALNKFELALGQSQADAEAQMSAMEDRFSERIKELRAELKALHKELAASLNKADREQKKEAQKLGEDKAERRELADLFRSIAQSLHPEKNKRAK